MGEGRTTEEPGLTLAGEGLTSKCCATGKGSCGGRRGKGAAKERGSLDLAGVKAEQPRTRPGEGQGIRGRFEGLLLLRTGTGLC